jgi:cytochrome c-type biogenesis protein CcsB
MKFLGAAVAAWMALGGSAPLDTTVARRLVVLDDGRVKPLDSFAREVLRSLTGKERLSGYRDPGTGTEVVVFGDADPVESLLRLVAEPERFRAVNFIRVDHPDLKRKYKLDEHRLYFSLKDFDACREDLRRDASKIDQDEASSAERAVISLLIKQRRLEDIFQERLLAMAPIPFGETGIWMTPTDLKLHLSGARPTDPRSRVVQAGLEEFLGKPESEPKLAAMREFVTQFERMKAAIATGTSAEFSSSVEALVRAQRALNPPEMSSDEDIDRELWYNRLKPFTWAGHLFLLSVMMFCLTYALDSKAVWMGALGLLSAAIGLTAYGYGLRWLIADRYPLSNHYESMIMVAFAGGIIALIGEILMRRRVFGLAGAAAACVMVYLAESVAIFAEQSAIKSIAPALMTFWMTIHVPVIMSGYAGALIICVLGHIYLFMHLFRRPSPEKAAELERLDLTMYRALQVTVLFLLAGILLGAVWAGEAWGRPWGWDMKETWALVTLVSYIAALHGRFTGYVKGLGTALFSIFNFMLVILCYYGVNFVFGRGLHTYGFGEKTNEWPVMTFFALEAALMITAAVVERRRKHSLPTDLPPA